MFIFVFDFLHFENNTPRSKFFGFSCLVFLEFSGSVVWCLSLIWENNETFLCQVFVPFFLLLCFYILSTCILDFCNCPSIPGNSIHSFIYLFVCLSIHLSIHLSNIHLSLCFQFGRLFFIFLERVCV